jgi:hypothetical protein
MFRVGHVKPGTGVALTKHVEPRPFHWQQRHRACERVRRHDGRMASRMKPREHRLTREILAFFLSSEFALE